MKARYLGVPAAVLLVATFLVCGPSGGCGLSNGHLTGGVTLPLLPLSLPVYPTDISMDGMVPSVETAASSIPLVGDLLTSGLAQEGLTYVENLVDKASLQILQPGPLTAQIQSQITQTIRNNVKVTNVGVTLELSNDTAGYIAVPVQFELYLGDGNLVKNWDPSVMILFDDTAHRQSDNSFIFKPGESVTLTLSSVPQLVEALNNSTSIGLAYKAIYRVADADNGADISGFLDKFLLCIVDEALDLSLGSCPNISQLLGWHFTFKQFYLTIDAESSLSIPPIPGCKAFANSNNLPNLANACSN